MKTYNKKLISLHRGRWLTLIADFATFALLPYVLVFAPTGGSPAWRVTAGWLTFWISFTWGEYA